MRWMIKNSKGKQDAMLTFALVAFLTVVLKVLMGGITVEIMGKSLGLGTIDASTIGAMLTPTLGAYCMRRHTDSKMLQQDPPQEAEESDHAGENT